jgi:chorismate lyase/3-hydroxybenzoate synthase
MPKNIDTIPPLAAVPIVEADASLAPMSWTSRWTGMSSTHRDENGIELTLNTGDRATLVTAIAPKARVSEGEAFRGRAIDVYRAIRRTLDASPHRHVVRMWNHIPGIHDPLDSACDRYMYFNAGRFAAMCEWFDGADNIPKFVPAASGVGHDGQDLVIHALATSEPGTPVENPQQIPAFRYSKRYGPLPPCFARATRVSSPEPALLIAGTAAITGEASRHIGDLGRQFELTIENLRILIRSGGGSTGAPEPLARMQQVRLYVLRSDDFEAVANLAREAFAPTAHLELVRADLCRSDLLVEIEGFASLW